jgi:hypothetical protein
VSLGPNLLSATIKLSPNQTNQPQTFSGTNSDTVTLAGHRASLRVQNSGGAAGSTAQLAIWGMGQQLQDQLSTLGMVIKQIPANTLTVAAGTDPNNLTTVFIGTIWQAYPDYAQMPLVPFRFECFAGAFELAAPFPVSSYTGATSVATVLSTIAAAQGWGFENNGVNVTLRNPYLSGTALQQVRTIAEHAHINAQLINNVLAIWPKYGNRMGSGTPLVAPPPDGQMLGYPNYTQQGIELRNLFDPRIVMGGQIQVKSSLQRTTGTWNVLTLDLALDSQVPGGKWEQHIQAYNPNFPEVLPSR